MFLLDNSGFSAPPPPDNYCPVPKDSVVAQDVGISILSGSVY